MSSQCEEFESKKMKLKLGDNFIPMRSISCPDVPQSALWNKDASHIVTHDFHDNSEAYHNFEIRPDDVFVVTYPRSGTTWTQELVWQICNDLDYETPKTQSLETRFPHLEHRSIEEKKMEFLDYMAILNDKKSRRFFKSHLPAPLLPKEIWTVKPKIVYVARNIKDVAVSYYHLIQNVYKHPGSFRDFLENFMNDKILYSPYHSHVFDFWRMRDEENVLFLTYGEMVKDHSSVIEKTAKFLGKSFNKDQILELAEYLSFNKFSKNASVNNLFRVSWNGKKGSYREDMPEDFIDKFNKWTLEEIQKAQMGPEIQNILLND